MKHFDPDYCPQFNDVSRRGFSPCFTNVQCIAPVVSIGEAVKCYGFFGSGDKNQSTTNTQTGASEDAQLVQDSGAAGKDDANVQGGSFNRNLAPGAVDLSAGQGVIDGQGGYGNKNIASGAYDLSGSTGNSIVVGATPAQIIDLSKDFGTSLTTAIAAQSEAGKTTLDKTLNKLTDLAQSQQTNGASEQNKTVLYVVALLVLAAVVFIYRKFK